MKDNIAVTATLSFKPHSLSIKKKGGAINPNISPDP